MRRNWEKSLSKYIYYIKNIERRRKKETERRSSSQKAECKAKKDEVMITKVTQQSIKKNSRVIPKKVSNILITLYIYNF